VSAALLDIDGITVGYGPITALSEVSLRIDPGEVVALLGANGAGKSTLLRTVIGFLAPRAGTLSFAGRSLSGLRPERRARLGLAYSPEGRRVFPGMTVRENLEVAANTGRRERLRRRGAVYDIFPQLAEKDDRLGWTLSGGQQQMLAIGRALMGAPRLLLLDEPSLGLSPILVQRLFALIGDLNNDGLTILLVEQNTHMALQTAARGYVLELGRVVIDGSAEQLRQGELSEAYLGSGRVGSDM